MPLKKDELEIVNVGDLMALNLTIPDYQRPYRWSANSTNTLFADTCEAFKSGLPEYRLGSVILHKENEEYHLVDGQQRTTTLGILLYVLGEENLSILSANYKEASYSAIRDNLALLQQRVNGLSESEKIGYKEYLETNCTLVKIVTDSEQEAFQFFDSQNSRGKALKPHDLLKSYHLREMTDETEQVKIDLVSQWENLNQNALEDLFRDYLYPVIRWFKHRDGLYYSSDEIHYFKGIKSSNARPYAIYHRASHLFVEQVNGSASRELLGYRTLSQFQLTQPLIAGKRFFGWTLHYATLLERVRAKIGQFQKSLPSQVSLPNRGSGDRYIRQLYEASLLFFADRFGFEVLDEHVMRHLFTWCYSLRIVMAAVYPQTINKYAKGQHDRINQGKDIFSLISEMAEPYELTAVVLDRIGAKPDKYSEIYELMKEWNGW